METIYLLRDKFDKAIRGAIVNEMRTEGNYVTFYPKEKDSGGLTTYGVTEKNYPGAFSLRYKPDELVIFMRDKLLPVLMRRGLTVTTPWQAVVMETSHIWWGIGRDESCIHNYSSDISYLKEFWKDRKLPLKGSLFGVTTRFIHSAKRYGYKIDNYRRKVENMAEIVLFRNLNS